MTDAGREVVERAAARVGRYRWVIVGLLFAATVINYIDRQMLGVLKDTLKGDLHWTEADFANVVFGSNRLGSAISALRSRPDRRPLRLCHRLRRLDAGPHRPWRRP